LNIIHRLLARLKTKPTKHGVELKKILITNDDGYESEGLKILADSVRHLGQVTIVAPATEKSACGHSLTLAKPMRFISVDDDFYKLDNGTPSDCIYLALHTLFEEMKPDIVLSGINKGSNMGEDITYSGTAAAAMEAALHGIPSIAFSQIYTKHDGKIIFDFDIAAKVSAEIVEKILNNGFPLTNRRFMNVNFPNVSIEQYKGTKITKAGYRLYGNDAELHRNPRGEEFWWLGLHPLQWTEYDYSPKEFVSDFEATNDGFVSISPIQLDMTAYESLDKLNKWL
jgi:5'-nucleotidase